jgi:hypothetical protein
VERLPPIGVVSRVGEEEDRRPVVVVVDTWPERVYPLAQLQPLSPLAVVEQVLRPDQIQHGMSLWWHLPQQ